MAHIGQFGFGGLVPAARPVGDCLRCGASGSLQVTQAFTNTMRGIAEYTFECPCGIEIDLSCDIRADPLALMKASRQSPASMPPPGLYSMQTSVSMPTQPHRSNFYGSGPSIYPVFDPEPPPADSKPVEPGPELKALEGSVIGYRAWRIQDWTLTGTGVAQQWTPGINEAKCAPDLLSRGPTSHLAPHADCHCGMYALARFDDKTSWWDDADVIGAVEAWADPDDGNHDRFLIHSTGFRSQYAKVILLGVSDDYPRAKNAAIRALATEHGADVCKREHLEDAAKEHGQLVPDEWLEWAQDDEPGPSSLSVVLRQMSQALQASSSSAHQMVQAMRVPAAPVKPKPEPRRKLRGVKATLKTAGPPFTGKWRAGDVIRDRRRDLWVCTHAGKPGSWQKI